MIPPFSSPTPQATSAVSGKIKQTVYNVRDYGAVADGVTDNAIAYGLVVAAVTAAGGGCVYLPEGRFYSSIPLIPDTLFTITGAGIDKTIILPSISATGATGDGIRLVVNSLPYAHNIVVRDLTIDSSAQYPTGQLDAESTPYSNGITLQGIDDLRIENVKIIKPYGYGVIVGAFDGNAPFVKRPIIKNLYVEGERGGYDSLGGGGILEGLIDGLYVYPAADGTNPYGTATDWTNLPGSTIKNVHAWTTFVNGPITALTTPAVPPTATPLYNPYPYTVSVAITGTISNVKINNVPTSLASTYTLPGFGQIYFEYSTPPTWIWTEPQVPNIPASTANATNPFDFPVPVTIMGGAVTAVKINGITQSGISGYFLVPVSGTISITYSVAPTWSWAIVATSGAIETDFGAINVSYEDVHLNGFHDGVILSKQANRHWPTNISISNSTIVNMAFHGIKTNVFANNGILGVRIYDNSIDRYGQAGAATGIQMNGTQDFNIERNKFGVYGISSYAINLASDGSNNCEYGTVKSNDVRLTPGFAIATTAVGSQVYIYDNPGITTTLNVPFVQTTGNEVIGGIKTFSSAPVVPSASFPEAAITNLVTDLGLKAPLASPTFTGTVTLQGNLTLGTAGNKITITTGSNASAGTGTLAGGTATISTTAVTANSLIFLTDTAASLTNVGILSVTAKSAGTSFTVTSSVAIDTSTFNWLIIN